jgi:hypothetical protein
MTSSEATARQGFRESLDEPGRRHAQHQPPADAALFVIASRMPWGKAALRRALYKYRTGETC